MFLVYVEHPLASTLTILVGIALALTLGWHRCRRMGISNRSVMLATILLPLLGCFFSHLFYCLMRLEYVLYEQPISYFFTFWQKGHMLYGGVAGCLLALWICAEKGCAVRMMDAYAPSGALMIAAARIAEGFLGQGYGEFFFDESVLCRFPFMVYDPSNELWAWALFTLEALIALVLFGLLLAKRPSRSGDSVLLLMGVYAAAQIVLESLRRDEFLRWGFVRCSELFSAVIVVVVLLCFHRRAAKGRAVSKALCWTLCAAMIVFCLLLEFATEGRIPFLAFLDVDGCYWCMAAACAALTGCLLWMRGLGGNNTEQQAKELSV